VIRLPFAADLDPVAELDRPPDEQPLCEVAVPSGNVVVLVPRYDDVKQVYSDSRFSRGPSAPGSPRVLPEGDWSDNPLSMVNMEGVRHAARRRPVSQHLTPRRIDALRPLTAELAGSLLDDMIAAGHHANWSKLHSPPAGTQPVKFLGGHRAKWPGCRGDEYATKHR
jgi:cytochrome P450